MRFLIVTPPYKNSSAGVRTLFRLCHWLNVLGEEAAVSTDIRHPYWNTPYGHMTRSTIVVYPEIIVGNPYGAERVVRWCGNLPGLLGGETSYADEELVFYHEAVLFDAVRAATWDTEFDSQREMRLSVMEPDIFYEDRSIYKTSYAFFWSGKSKHLRDKYGLTDDAQRIEISPHYPPTREMLGQILRECKEVFSYDAASAILPEALACGANVSYFLEGRPVQAFTEADFMNRGGFPLTPPEIARQYYSTQPVERFIRICEKRFG